MAKRHKSGDRKGKVKSFLRNNTVELYSKNPNKEFNYKQICALFDINDSSLRKLINDILFELRDEGILTQVERGKYKWKGSSAKLKGTIQFTQRGSAYVIPDNPEEEDVFISTENTGIAFNGDRVLVELLRSKRSKPEGIVDSVLERGRKAYVGTIDRKKDFAFCVCDKKHVHVDFYIDKDKLKGAVHGDKVIVELTGWPNPKASPFGEVMEILGKTGENNAEIHAILAEYGLPYKFPYAVEKEAEKIGRKITGRDREEREDFTDRVLFTIDPEDAKDFDDALSVKKLENGNYEIGVHIADVSHFVRPGSIIDEEARVRGNSVYLVDRVVPMLPEVLSNNVCSLRPNEDRLAFSAVFEMDSQSKVHKAHFAKTIIHSKRRFSYEEAQEIIEKGEGELSEEILLLDNLAKQLRAKRLEKGAMEVDSVEVKFKLDEKGKPLGVYTKVSKDAHKLIEEFMLLANRAVSEYIGRPVKGKREIPFVYRVHDTPDEQKLDELRKFIFRFGYKLRQEKNKPISHALNKVLEEARENGDSALISPMIVRSMAKAIYTTENIGHYGLGFSHYTHFTSPIRRYPDLLVHRILEHVLTSWKPLYQEKELEEMCKACSQTERKAAEAERASTKYMQVVYLSDKVGEIFDGVISGVTDWGMYVELNENRCEGLVHIKTLRDDSYYFDSDKFMIVGRKHKQTFSLGDAVTVKIKGVDQLARTIDLVLIE
jgi:ribonuclease R